MHFGFIVVQGILSVEKHQAELPIGSAYTKEEVMKKLYFVLCSLLCNLIFVVTNVFADGGIETSKSLFEKLDGWQVVIVILCFVLIWVIRATKTKKDDEILDKYVATAVEYALKVMPANAKIDWVKFVGNALGKFNEIYTKTNELPPDAKLYDRAKQLIEKITEIKQIEQSKAA